MGPALALLLAAGGLPPATEVVDLEVGAVLEVEQRADETRVFRVRLEAGRAYLLEVGQRELDIIVSITAPDGIERSFDAPLLRFEPERLLLEPELSGVHQVALSSREFKRGSARVDLHLASYSAATVAGEVGHDALRQESRAAEANHAGGMDNWRQAAELYRAAADGWRSAGARENEARARLAKARLLYQKLAAWQESASEAAHSAAIYQNLGNLSAQAGALHVQGASFLEMAQFDEAETLLQSARQIRQQLGEHYEQARVVNELGVSAYLQGNWHSARHSFEMAAQLLRAEDEWADELKALGNLAAVDHALGNLTQALQGYQRILELNHPGEPAAGRGDLLDNMGAAYRALGQLSEALACYQRALAVHEEHDSLKGRGRSLSGLGVTYYGFGDLELARDYLDRALAVRRKARDGPGQVSTLLFLGRVYLEQGEIDRAIEAHMAAVDLSASPRERARAQAMLGRDLAAAGQVAEALAILEAAHATGLGAGTPIVAADALLEQGRLLIATNRIDEAEASLQQALQHYRSLSWTSGEAQVLHQLGRAAYVRGDLDQALDYAGGAVDRTEMLRNLIVNPELRASFLASQREPYSLYITITVDLAGRTSGRARQAWLERALEASERARTRAMLELIQDTAGGTLPVSESELEVQRGALYTTLAGLRTRQNRLLERGQKPAEVAEVAAALSRVETELRVVEGEIRKQDPRQASLTASMPLNAPAIQAALDEDLMLLQYELGDERSWLFAVTRNTIAVHPLPPRQELERLARLAHRLLQQPNLDRASRAERDATLAALSRVLVEPARPLHARLALALDGALHFLPFAALPNLAMVDRREPLVLSHELISVPSVSVVAAQRILRIARQPPIRTVAVFADPVFSSDDPRFDAPQWSDRVRADATATTRGGLWSLDALPRLPATAREAEAIAALVTAEQRLIVTGFDASRAAVMSTPLGEFRVLHFATHALVDDRYPALSALAFSAFSPDRTPLDGLIRLHEIYNLSLGADLVVLSACETALGRELRGEGLLSLTRGFLHAGSKSVVASLWQVPDRATAGLMRDFHEQLLFEGLPPSAAMRHAQLARRASRGLHDPYYWASFVVHGEWRKSPEPGIASSMRGTGIDMGPRAAALESAR